jgi:hypothetical protein
MRWLKEERGSLEQQRRDLCDSGLVVQMLQNVPKARDVSA